MDSEDGIERDETRIGALASLVLGKIELAAYIIVGLLLGCVALIGMWTAAASLRMAFLAQGNAISLVFTVDRLLFVLMVVEIMHTIRVSSRSGTLVCEPFLVVGLIASIRRVLVITLESSQAGTLGTETAELHGIFSETMVELGVLGGLILVMVISIFMLRLSGRTTARERSRHLELKKSPDIASGLGPRRTP